MPFGAGRQPDKPGTYRIRPAKNGGMRLSGVRADGTRVRMGGLSTAEANEIAGRLFKSAVAIPAPSTDWAKTDDWGFPLKVSDDTIASVASTLNIPDPAAPVDPVAQAPEPPTKEDVEKRERRAKNAKGLMDLAGIAGSAGVVIAARRLTVAVGKEPVNPDTKQVGNLRDSIRETLTEWFGESEIAPWQMVILLAFGIPISMMLQSPRKKELEKVSTSQPETKLSSVP